MVSARGCGRNDLPDLGSTSRGTYPRILGSMATRFRGAKGVKKRLCPRILEPSGGEEGKGDEGGQATWPQSQWVYEIISKRRIFY